MIEELEAERWADNFITSLLGRKSNDVWTAVKSKINHLKEKFFPKARITGKPAWTEKGSVPISETLREAIRKKHAEHRHWIAKKKRGNAHEARIAFTKARNKVSTMMRKATRNFEKSIARSSKMNPKLFWAHVRRRMKTKAGVAPLLESKEDKTSLKFGDKEKASILQDQFSSVFTKEPTGDVPTLGKLTNALIRSIEITAEMVKKELSNLKTNKSPGPDGIHPLMLEA